MSQPSLSDIAYSAFVKEYGTLVYEVNKNKKYNYIEKDGTLSWLGLLLDIITGTSGNPHDGFMHYCGLKFENTSESRYHIWVTGYNNELYSERVPIIEVQE